MQLPGGVRLRKEKHERYSETGGSGCRRWEAFEPAKIATGENVVLFMTRSVIDKDCRFFKDKIVTTDTQKETDKGACGA